MAPTTCAKCEGTGWTPVSTGTLRRMQPCECRQVALQALRMAASRIPPRYFRCDFDRFVTYDNERLLRALAVTRTWAETFPAVERGLCFIGPSGIGKTHLAIAALRILIETKHIRGVFYDVRDLLKLIRSSYSKESQTSEMSILQPVVDAELLVLDDLGAEKPSAWVEETLTLIVNERYNAKRPTIFTTNYEDTPEEDLDSLRVRVGFRMHSRLHEMCEFLEFSGGDFRMLPPNGDGADLAALWKRGRARGRGLSFPPRASGPMRAELAPPHAAGRASVTSIRGNAAGPAESSVAYEPAS